MSREKTERRAGRHTQKLRKKTKSEIEPQKQEQAVHAEARDVMERKGLEKKKTGAAGRSVGKLKKKRKRRKRILAGSAAVLLAVLAGFVLLGRILNFNLPGFGKAPQEERPDALLLRYYGHLAKGEYDKMYRMLDEESRTSISRKDFVKRHENIYQGIGADHITVKIKDVDKIRKGGFSAAVTYYVQMDTLAGTVDFQNKTFFIKLPEEEGAPHSYGISWDDSMIFPDLTAKDKVLISTKPAKRGNIYDRNGKLLAGEGTASMAGLVVNKMDPKNSSRDIKRMAKILDISAKSIQKQLQADWVQEDLFVPVKMIEKLTDLEQMTDMPDAHIKQKMKRDAALLAIPGVKICDTPVRQYPLGAAASHLIGYVQQATLEDLEAHAGEGYTENSLIGKSGIEAVYEKELRGEDGSEIVLVDAGGEIKNRLAYKEQLDGKDIYLTIDADLQETIYDTFAEDKGCSLAMNPYTGEVLAMVSTPSFNANDFVLGMSDALWDDLNQDERKPLYNRFRQKLCPGSSFKPIIAAIGMQTGAVDPQKDYGNAGLKWQKDAGWGAYYVTTLHAYEPVTMENALIYSDNIYFARAALRIGKKNLQKGLKKLGFHKKIPFELSMAQSQYSNEGKLESEIQLADSGYGQGQILVNPLHLAALYTGFLNNGNVIKPYLIYASQAQAKGKIWLESAYTPQAAQQIKDAMVQIIKSKEGTGHRAYRKGTELAGKTGTAEIKRSKDDKNGTELGWFVVFTADEQEKNPLLLLSMAEDVHNRGGSGYVVKKDRKILNEWLKRES